MADYDLAIIGGVLNGVSVARDAAGRGLRVILLEQGDLGSAASAASPRLIHGDLAVLGRRAVLRVREEVGERASWRCWRGWRSCASAWRWPSAIPGCGSRRIWYARCALRFRPIPTSVHHG